MRRSRIALHAGRANCVKQLGGSSAPNKTQVYHDDFTIDKMSVRSGLRPIVAILAALLLAFPGGVDAFNRKADKLAKLAQKAEDRKDWDAALSLYEQALNVAPGDIAFQTGAQRVRFQAGQAHVEQGTRLREAGHLEQALSEFQRGFAIDPSSSIALQQIKETTELIEKAKKNGGVSDLLSPLQESNKESLERISSLQSVPVLKPINRRITNLKMNNQPVKVLYETIAKLAGINVIVDPSFQSSGKNANVDLTNATLEEALDYVAMVTHTFWKPITSNTIFVAEENPTKRRDYEDQVVKVFYLKNITSPQEFQEVVTAVRSITDIRRIFTYNEQSAAVVRGSADQIALAEKIFHDLDKPKAEVVVDIIVLSTSIQRTRDLAMALLSNGTAGINIPISFTPRASLAIPNTATGTNTTNNGTTGGTGATGVNGNTGVGTGITGALGSALGSTAVALSNIVGVSTRDFSAVLPGALLEAMMSDNNTKVLQSPQVRASDGMKVTLKVGQKYPYATGSFQPGVGTVGVSPLVSTQFQFLDTGVDLELQPHVHGTDEITMHIDFKLSNVQGQVNLGGLSQPIVAQQTNSTDVRVRNGQVTLLGGVMSTTDTSNLNGIPGMVNIPILGKFLGSQNHKEVDRNDLVIAIIPHIVRTAEVDDVDLRGVFAGTDQQIKVIHSSAPEPAPPVAETPAPASPAPPNATALGVLNNAAAVAVPATMKLTFTPADAHVKSGESFAVNLNLDGAVDLFSAPVKLAWDPKILKLVSAAPGVLIAKDGQVLKPPADIQSEAGQASIPLARLPGAGGVNGTGPLAVLNFVAIGKGSATVAITQVDAKNSKQEHLPASMPQLKVTVE